MYHIFPRSNSRVIPLEATLELTSIALDPTAVETLDEPTRTPEEILNICQTELQTGDLSSFHQDDYVMVVLDAIRRSLPCVNEYSALIYSHYFFILLKYEKGIGGRYKNIADIIAGYHYLIEHDKELQPHLTFLWECSRKLPASYIQFAVDLINPTTQVNTGTIPLKTLLEEHISLSARGFLIQLAQLPRPNLQDLTRQIVEPEAFLRTFFEVGIKKTISSTQETILWPLGEVCRVWDLFRQELANFYSSVEFLPRDYKSERIVGESAKSSRPLTDSDEEAGQFVRKAFPCPAPAPIPTYDRAGSIHAPFAAESKNIL